jgi:hypothetical protein
LENKFIYLIKVKGNSKIPDSIQLRDEEFTLLAHSRMDRPEKALIKAGFQDQLERLRAIIDGLPFGKMHKVEY